jgi:acyl carrier protein
MSVGEQVRDFVHENFLFGDRNVTFDNSDSFIEKGIVDSTGVLELVSFVEDRFNFTIHDEEIIPDNLDSIKNLTSFIEKKIN